jgi:hypothetical protein
VPTFSSTKRVSFVFLENKTEKIDVFVPVLGEVLDAKVFKNFKLAEKIVISHNTAM